MRPLPLALLVLAGCASVRDLPVEHGDEVLRGLQVERGRPVVVQVRGEGYVRGRLGDVRADTLWLREGGVPRAVPREAVCAVTTAGPRRRAAVGQKVGGLLGVAFALGVIATADEDAYFGRGFVVVGAVSTVPFFVLVGGVVGQATTPSTRYVFDARCR